MYPFLRCFEYRQASQQLLRLNKFGIHGLNFNTGNFATYRKLRDLHPDHQFFDGAQRDDAQNKLDAAIYKQYSVELPHAPAIVQVSVIASHQNRLHRRPLNILVDGMQFAQVSSVMAGRHLLFEKEMAAGHYFVQLRREHSNEEFFPFAPGGFSPYRKQSSGGHHMQHYFAPGKCMRLCLVQLDSAKGGYELYVKTEPTMSTPDNPFVY